MGQCLATLLFLPAQVEHLPAFVPLRSHIFCSPDALWTKHPPSHLFKTCTGKIARGVIEVGDHTGLRKRQLRSFGLARHLQSVPLGDSFSCALQLRRVRK